jgi:hypothetical protein
MGRNGSQAGYSLAQDLGITGLIISTATSTTISTFARVIVVRFLRAATVLRNTALSSMVRRCMTRVAVKVPLAINRNRHCFAA